MIIRCFLIFTLLLSAATANAQQSPPTPPRGVTTETAKPAYYCGATTKKGTACKRRVKAQGTRCYQHKEAK